MNQADLVDLAHVFTLLSELAAKWDMYWFAGRYLDVAEVLLDRAKPVTESGFKALTLLAANQHRALGLLEGYCERFGEAAARKEAIRIDNENATLDKDGKNPGSEYGCPPMLPLARRVPVLGPVGAADTREFKDYPCNSRGGLA